MKEAFCNYISSIDQINESIIKLNSSFIHFNGNLDAIVLSEKNNLWGMDQSAFFGLLGVIVGAIITFIFNEVGRKKDAKARFAVQKKNLIYAPIYKELLNLSEYIEENSEYYYLQILEYEPQDEWSETYYVDRERKRVGQFIQWNKIKKDIRKNYLPTKLRVSLEALSKNIQEYTHKRQLIEEKYELLWEEKVGIAGSSYRNNMPSDFLKKELSGNITVKEKFDDPEVNKKIADFLNSLPNLIDRKKLIQAYGELVASIHTAEEEVNKLVEYVITQYEYGKELENYE